MKQRLEVFFLRVRWALRLLTDHELPAGTLEFLETQEEAWESS